MKRHVFLSYCRADNTTGFVTELRARIQARYAELFPGEELEVFFDSSTIQAMDQWKLRIEENLKRAEALIACISDTYFTRPWCEMEWQRFEERELELGLPDGVCVLMLQEALAEDPRGITETQQEWRDAIRNIQRLNLWEVAADDPAALAGEAAVQRLDELCTALHTRFTTLTQAQASKTNLPVHSPKYFVGRRKELHALRHEFFGGPTSRTVLIHGLGGIGKSSLAEAYAHQMRTCYPGGRWLLDCTGRGDLRILLISRAELWDISLSPFQKKDTEAGYFKICQFFDSIGKPILLILENIDNQDLLKRSDLTRLMNVGVHVLAISRRAVPELADSGLTNLVVDKIRSHEGLRLFELLRPFRGEEDRVAAEELCKLLDGFSLGIATSAAYLAIRSEVAYADYLAQLKSSGLPSLEGAMVEVLQPERARSLSITLQPTLLALCNLEWDLVQWAAVMPPGFVAQPLLEELVRACQPRAVERPSSAILSDFEKAIDRLKSFRLLVPASSENCLEMHRMIAQVVLNPLISEVRHQQSTWLTRLRNWLTRSTVEEPGARISNFIEKRGRDYCQPLIPRKKHWEINPLVAAAALWLEEKRPTAPELANLVCRPLTEVHGRHLEATGLMEKAIDLLTERNSYDGYQMVDGVTISCWLCMIGLEIIQCKPTEALTRCRLVEKIFEDNDFRDATILSLFNKDYGTCLELTGDIEGATQRFNKVIELENRHSTPSDLKIDAVLGLARCGMHIAFIMSVERCHGEKPTIEQEMADPMASDDPYTSIVQACWESVKGALMLALIHQEDIKKRGIGCSPNTMAEVMLNMALLFLLKNPESDLTEALTPAEELVNKSNLASSPMLPRILVTKAISSINSGKLEQAAECLRKASESEAALSGKESVAYKQLNDFAENFTAMSRDNLKSLLLVLKSYLYLGAHSLDQVATELATNSGD